MNSHTQRSLNTIGGPSNPEKMVPNSENPKTEHQKFHIFRKTSNLKFERFAQKIENWFLEDHILRAAYTFNIAQITMFLWILLRIRCVRIRKKL